VPATAPEAARPPRPARRPPLLVQ